MRPSRFICALRTVAIFLILAGTVGAARAQEPSFTVFYGPLSSPESEELFGDLPSSEMLEGYAEFLNDALSLPEPITLSFIECGEANAFYLPEDRQVAVCYELFELFVKELSGDEDAELLIGGVFTWFLMHELGHAFIHILDLPITGLEEDAVDQLATLLLLDGSEEGEYAIVATAIWFNQRFETGRVAPELLADEHSLNAQRSFNIMCWAYGSDPKENAELIELGWVTAERAPLCASQFERMQRAWELLLQPYIKDTTPSNALKKIP